MNQKSVLIDCNNVQLYMHVGMHISMHLNMYVCVHALLVYIVGPYVRCMCA